MNENQDPSTKLDNRETREFDAETGKSAHRRRVRAWIVLLFLVPGIAMMVYIAVDQFRMMLGH